MAVRCSTGFAQVEELITVKFSATEGGTIVTVVHVVDAAAGDTEALRQGWEAVLERLGNLTH